MVRARYECDLHTHTNCSDGRDSPKEAIDKAAAAGIRVMAITDHDVVPASDLEDGGRMVPVTEYACGKGVTLIPGIEISCDTENEDVHLVCLGCNWAHPYFKELEITVRESKLESYFEMVKNFSKKGYKIAWEDVLLKTGNIENPSKIQKKQIFQYLADQGIAPDWSAVKKLVQTTPELSVKRRKPEAASVIRAIHESGGIVIMAHPYLVDDSVIWSGKQITRELYIRTLVGAGLDGIESRYPYHKTSYRGNKTTDEIEQEILRLFSPDVPILSGGSDYHGETEAQTAHPRMLGEEGITYEYMTENPMLKLLL